MKQLLAFLLVLLSLNAFSQVPVKLSLKFKNAGEDITGSAMPALNGVAYRITALAFYISEVSIIHDGNQETAIDSVYLFDLHYRDVVLENLDITTVEGIKFRVGVPEALNHLDISQYPEDHPLSFQTPPMQWGWNAGYMHFIMSGYGDSNNDGEPETANPYELHCLGDENTKLVHIMTAANLHADQTREIILDVNIDQWLEGTDPATTGAQHANTGINADVMNNVNLNPVFVAPQNAGLAENSKLLQLNVFQDGNDAKITWDENIAASSYELLGPDGRIAQSGKSGKSEIAFMDMKSGLHLVRLYGPKSSVLGSAKWIVP